MAMEDSVATCDNMLDEMPPPEGKTSWSSINWVLELCVVYDWKVVSGHGKAFKWKCKCCGRTYARSFIGTNRIEGHFAKDNKDIASCGVADSKLEEDHDFRWKINSR